MNEQIADAGHKGGAGDGEHPGGDDALAPNPADGADALRGADAEDRAGDGVGGADGDLGDGGEDDGGGGGGLGGKAADRLEPRDPRAHRLDDAPAAVHRPQGDGGVAEQDDPPGHVMLVAEDEKVEVIEKAVR